MNSDSYTAKTENSIRLERNSVLKGEFRLRHYYYVLKSETSQIVDQINQKQSKSGIFVNISIKPYRGKKYDPQNTVVIVVG